MNCNNPSPRHNPLFCVLVCFVLVIMFLLLWVSLFVFVFLLFDYYFFFFFCGLWRVNLPIAHKFAPTRRWWGKNISRKKVIILENDTVVRQPLVGIRLWWCGWWVRNPLKTKRVRSQGNIGTWDVIGVQVGPAMGASIPYCLSCEAKAAQEATFMENLSTTRSGFGRVGIGSI